MKESHIYLGFDALETKLTLDRKQVILMNLNYIFPYYFFLVTLMNFLLNYFIDEWNRLTSIDSQSNGFSIVYHYFAYHSKAVWDIVYSTCKLDTHTENTTEATTNLQPYL